jgi:hypothetical protein
MTTQKMAPPFREPELQEHPGEVLKFQWWRYGDYIAGFRVRERAEAYGRMKGWLPHVHAHEASVSRLVRKG